MSIQSDRSIFSGMVLWKLLSLCVHFERFLQMVKVLVYFFQFARFHLVIDSFAFAAFFSRMLESLSIAHSITETRTQVHAFIF